MGLLAERTNAEWRIRGLRLTSPQCNGSIRDLRRMLKRSLRFVLSKRGEGYTGGILTTKKDEISCDECFEELNCFVEIVLQGKNPAGTMLPVQDHLDRWRDCREEYQTLLEVLKNMEASGRHSNSK